jgi:hypothetical protein
MPATRSQTTTGKTIAQTLDPTKPKRGKKKAQPEPNDFDIPDIPPPHNPTKPAGLERHQSGEKQHPKATPAYTKDKDTQPVPLTNNTRKRGRTTGATTERVPDDIPPVKRAKAGSTNQPPVKEKSLHGQKKNQPTNARDPLPDRPGRNIHPAKLPAARRTTQQVAAENAAKKQAIEEKIRELERAKEILAQMNVSEELGDEELVHDNPQRLSAAVRKQNRMFLDDRDAEVRFSPVLRRFC